VFKAKHTQVVGWEKSTCNIEKSQNQEHEVSFILSATRMQIGLFMICRWVKVVKLGPNVFSIFHKNTLTIVASKLIPFSLILSVFSVNF
jgi:hypothetical protein